MMGFAVGLCVLLTRQTLNRVQLFENLEAFTPSPKYLRKGLDAAPGKGHDDQIAKAYFRGMLQHSGADFAKQLRAASYSRLGQHMPEAIPSALAHFAAIGDARPIEAVIGWPWDGAPGEVYSDVLADILKAHPNVILRMMSSLSPKTRGLVCEEIGGLLVKREVTEEIRKAELHKQKELARLWRRIRNYASDP